MRLLSTLVAVVAFVLAAHPARAQERPDVRTRLVADVKTAAAGEPFRVGVLIDLPEGWHIYWKYSGESGFPTDVEFHGVDAGSLQYPLPRHQDLGGGVEGFCYEGSVLLLATARVPADVAPTTTSLTIRAKASWLCCKDACVKGDASLALVLPLGAKAEAGPERKLFDDWQARVPTEPGAALVSQETKGSLAEDVSANELETTLRFREPVAKPEFFPAPEDALWVSAVHVTQEGNVVRIRFRAAVTNPKKLERASLESVLSFDVGGVRRSYVLQVPLRPPVPSR